MADRQNLLSDQVDDTEEFGTEDELGNPKKLVHPVAVFFHLGFKIAALAVYMLFYWISNNFAMNFVLTILILAMDFWTTKNISGRLLVGLRWWNYVDDDGKSHWMFESKQGKQKETINSSESRIFWSSLFITQILWILLLVISFFRFNFKWMVIVVTANIFNGANLYGYIKCRIGSGKSVKEYATGLMSRRLFSAALSSLSRTSTQDQPGPPRSNSMPI